MFRSILIVLLFASSLLSQALAQPVGEAPAKNATSPTAAAAQQEFKRLQDQWKDLYQQLHAKGQAKGSASRGHREIDHEIDHEIEAISEKIEAMVDQIVAAGIEAHRAGLTGDSTINSTLVAIAGFYVTGDSNGDGGDQYEKALPVIKSMLAAGLGDLSKENGAKENGAKELWLWGGVSAFCLNDYPLAEQYLSQARKSGLLNDTPPGQGPGDPINRVWNLAKTQNAALAATSRAWQKEKQIREKEAAADNLPRVKFHTTRGDVTIELFENEAPQAVASFINLVKSGFYDGIVFHRVLPAFMAQGGDPTGTSGGGPGYNIRCECHGKNYRRHFRGSLSMAHAGRDTGGSQFFLTFVPTSYLDGRHTVFGRVIEGMDAAASLKRVNPQGPGAGPTPDKIVKAHVLRDRGHEYKFEKLQAR